MSGAHVARRRWCGVPLSEKRHALPLEEELRLAEADYQRRSR